MLALLLGLLWGGVALAVGSRVAARADAAERARALRGATDGSDGIAIDRVVAAVAPLLDRLGLIGRLVRDRLQRRVAGRRDRTLARELPAAIDLLAVAMSAGATPFAAVGAVARWAPPTIADAFSGIVAACGIGAPFDRALHDAARRDSRVGPLVALLSTGARLGGAVNDGLARLAAEARRDLRRRAEARARTVPVRLLFPLVFLVLPAFGLLTVVPAIAAGFHGL